MASLRSRNYYPISCMRKLGKERLNKVLKRSGRTMIQMVPSSPLPLPSVPHLLVLSVTLKKTQFPVPAPSTLSVRIFRWVALLEKSHVPGGWCHYPLIASGPGWVFNTTQLCAFVSSLLYYKLNFLKPPVHHFLFIELTQRTGLSN